MPPNKIQIRKAVSSDISDLKALADAHKNELGFVLRPALTRSVDNRSIIVAIPVNDQVLAGFVDYHHRKDSQTTIYHIVVASDWRRIGIGRELVEALRSEAMAFGKHRIVLKCPEDLMANAFYQSIGFRVAAVEIGKTRPLNVWQLTVTSL
jgi:ribosomal protein S18 acetylase RimI-like enzyme